MAQQLKVLNYNVGLLDRAKILGFIDRVAVPEIEARRAVLPDAILELGYDVVLLTAKAYDLGSAMDAVAPAMGPGTRRA